MTPGGSSRKPSSWRQSSQEAPPRRPEGWQSEPATLPGRPAGAAAPAPGGFCFEEVVAAKLDELRAELLHWHDQEVAALHDELREMRSQLDADGEHSPRTASTASERFSPPLDAKGGGHRSPRCERARAPVSADEVTDREEIDGHRNTQRGRARVQVSVDDAADCEDAAPATLADDGSAAFCASPSISPCKSAVTPRDAVVAALASGGVVTFGASRSSPTCKSSAETFNSEGGASLQMRRFSTASSADSARSSFHEEPLGSLGKTRFALRDTWLSKYALVNNELDSSTLITNHIHIMHHWAKIEARGGSVFSNASMPAASFTDACWPPWDPHARAFRIWALIASALLGYDVIMVPLDVAFVLPPEWYLALATRIGRCFWTLDIVVNLLTAKYIGGLLERRLSRNVMQYLSTWFLFDFTVVALEWAMLFMTLHSTVSLARVGKLMRLLRLLRVKHLRHLCRDIGYVLSLRMPGSAEIISDFVIITSCLAIWVHMATCFWYSVGRMTDAGWVFASEDVGSTVSSKYIQSLHWTLSILHGQTVIRPRTTLERAFTSAAVLAALLFVCFLNAKMILAVKRLTESTAAHLQHTSERFLKSRHVSPQLSQRVRDSLRAYTDESLGEQLKDQASMMSSLPLALQCDLLAEVRGSMLVHMRFLHELSQGNQRIIGLLSYKAMDDMLALKGETIFGPGDGSQCMYFVDTGALFFRSVRQIKEAGSRDAEIMEQRFFSARQPTSSRRLTTAADPDPRWSDSNNNRRTTRQSARSRKLTTADPGSSPSGTKLGPNKFISEPTLWIDWDHQGELIAWRDSIVLLLNARQFSDVITSNQGACVHAVKYARHFAWQLNHDIPEPDDLVDINLPMAQLDTELFAGSEKDHFIFISHYKKEAGTEATLMQGEVERLVREDSTNAASELRSPVFLDSENLHNLEMLTEHVRRSRNVILLLTPGVLKRVWCLVEIVTAQRHGVPILPVEIQRPGVRFEYPSDEYYRRLREQRTLSRGDHSVLEEEGICMQELEEAVRQVFKTIALPFSPHRSSKLRRTELQEILFRCPPMEFVLGDRE